MKLLIALIALISIQCVYSQRPSSIWHYANPFQNSCLRDEAMLGNTSNATCSASCNYNSCPYDKPPSMNVTPICLSPNAYGNRLCALRCGNNSMCPSGARCYKLNMNEEQRKFASRDRKLQQQMIAVCLYDNYRELPGEVLLDE